MDCIFCKIANKEIAGDLIYEDDDVIVLKDINPVAPVHFLAIPKKHYSSILEIETIEDKLMAQIFKVICKIAKEMKIDGGFRVVTNTGGDAGQSVEHLHFHILGGRKFHWPPG